MTQRVTYSVVDQPTGHFDVVVLLGSRSCYVRSGYLTLADAESDIAVLRSLMAACGAPVSELRDCTIQPEMLIPGAPVPKGL